VKFSFTNYKLIEKHFSTKLLIGKEQISKSKETRPSSTQARNQLRTPRVAKSFLRGAQFFKLCPIVFNYAQRILQGGEKLCRRGFAPLRPSLVTGLPLPPFRQLCQAEAFTAAPGSRYI